MFVFCVRSLAELLQKSTPLGQVIIHISLILFLFDTVHDRGKGNVLHLNSYDPGQSGLQRSFTLSAVTD